MMIGMRDPDPRSSSSTSKPVFPGMFTSSTSRSNSSVWASASAEAPSWAT